MKKLTALLILDGFGYREEKEDNAILIDGVKNIRKLWESYPHTKYVFMYPRMRSKPS